MQKLTDSEKTALAVTGAVAALAILYYLYNAGNAVTTSPSGLIIPAGGTTASGGPVTVQAPPDSAYGSPTITPNPATTNPNTGTPCACGCGVQSATANNSLDNLTAQYADYLNSTEQSYVKNLLNTWESNAYPGSLNVGESGDNFELIYGGQTGNLKTSGATNMALSS